MKKMNGIYRFFVLMAMIVLLPFSYAVAQNTVTVYVTDNQFEDQPWGTVTGNEGSYANGTIVTVTVTPIAGKEVKEWYNVDGDLIASYTNTCDVVVSGNTEVWAVLGNATIRHTLSVNVLPQEYANFCSVSGVGEILDGDNPTLTASYTAPYTIHHWEIGGVQVAGNSNTYTLQPMHSDVTVDAYFTYMMQDRTISVVSNDPDHGSVLLKNSSDETGTSLSITEGDTLTLIATELDAENYRFSGWYLGDNLLSSNTIYGFRLPEGSNNVTYTAHFENATTTYTMTANYVPAAGAATMNPNPTANPRVGNAFTFSTTAAENYSFLGWYDEEDNQLTDQLSYTIARVIRPRTLTAKFHRNPYTVVTSVNPAGTGTVTPAGTTEVESDHNNINITATANDGYWFTGWSGGITGTANPYPLTVTRNYTDASAIVANFIATHTITLVNATLAYTGTTAHDGRYEHGTTYRVNPAIRNGFVFSHWKVGTTEYPDNTTVPYEGVLNDDVTIEAMYKPLYNVTLIYNPGDATGITFVGDGSHVEGDEFDIRVNYDQDAYTFIKWTNTNTGADVSAYNPYHVASISGNINLTAQLERISQYYDVTVEIEGNGAVYSDQLTTIPGINAHLLENRTIILTQEAAAGSVFHEWVVTTPAGTVHSTNPTYSFSLTANTTVQAVFTESSVHHVTVNNNLNDPNIIVSGLNDGGIYNNGDRLELFAYVQGNNPNYQFVGWFEGTTLLGTNPTFVIDPVERDYNLTVYFFASVNPDQEDYLIYNDPDLRTQVLGVIEGYRNRVTTVTIPASVTSIADGAFRNCTALTTVTIPANVESLGSYVFDNCSALTTVNLHNGLTLGDYAFNNCTALQAVTLPADLTAIPEGLFKGCTSLQNVVLPAGVTSIGSYAYNGCSSIYTLDLPGTVETVGAQAFSRMEGLRFVTLNGGTQSFGNDCFNFSNAIVSTTFNGTLEQWLAIDFANANAQPMSRSRNLFLNGQMLTDVVIPDGTTEIKAFAFFYDTLITRVTIPATVTRIDSMAFYRLTNLERIVLQGMPATVHADAFRSVDKENVIVEVPCNDYTADMTWEGFSHVISAGMPAFNIVQRPGGVVTITSAPTCNSIAYTYTISATPGAYNMFQSWSDGNTDNPRTLTITEDVTLSPIWNRSPDARVTMNPYFTFDVPEDEASWYGANNGANQWVIGSAAHFNRTGKGLYVTNDGGTTNAYDASSSPYVYTEFNLAAGFYRMGFNYRVAGEKGDFLSVALFPEDGSYPDVTPHTDGGIILYDSLYNVNVDEWDAKERIVEIAEGHEGWYRLVFFWTANDDDNIVNPAAAVDNVYASYVQPNVLQGSWARVTVSSNDEAMGSAYTCLNDNGEHKLTDLYYFGDDIQIHAVPTDVNYRFVRWSDGSREAHRHFNFVDIYGTTTNLTAFFEPVPDHYNVTVDIEAGASNGALQFGVEVNGEYLHYAQIPNGQNATVKLNLPQDGWAFMGWWNGTDTIHENPYIYTAGTDITLIALMKEWQPCDGSGINGNFDFSSSVPRGDNFEYRFPALDDVTVSNVNIYVNQHQIVVEEANGVEVKLFDVNGRLLSTLKDNVMPLRIDVPASGSYMVQVGNLLTKKVVVIK